METVIKIFIGIFISMFLVGVFGLGVSRQERTECNRWLEDQAIYPQWFSTQWQKDQCKQWNIYFTK